VAPPAAAAAAAAAGGGDSGRVTSLSRAEYIFRRQRQQLL